MGMTSGPDPAKGRARGVLGGRDFPDPFAT
jgi:hypothetical protein